MIIQRIKYIAAYLAKNAKPTNMPNKMISDVCDLSDDDLHMLRRARNEFSLSARAYDRILKVSRTIADLDGNKQIQPSHVSEAIQYRSLDRDFWSK